MKAGRIKTALADLILDFLGEGWSIDPEDLRVNHGSSKFTDWCSWTGTVYDSYGTAHSICSWSNMTDLLKNGKTYGLAWVGKGLDVINGGELTHNG